MAAFIASIPWNFYAPLTIFKGFLIIFTGPDFGPMRTSEEKALQGNVGGIQGGGAEPPKANTRGTVIDILLPITALSIFAVMA